MIGRGERGEGGEKGNSGAGLAAVPSLCLFFRYLSAFKVYAMKNAPQFGGLLLVLFSFLWGFYFAASCWSFRTRCAEKVHKI